MSNLVILIIDCTAIAISIMATIQSRKAWKIIEERAHKYDH